MGVFPDVGIQTSYTKFLRPYMQASVPLPREPTQSDQACEDAFSFTNTGSNTIAKKNGDRQNESKTRLTWSSEKRLTSGMLPEAPAHVVNRLQFELPP